MVLRVLKHVDNWWLIKNIDDTLCTRVLLCQEHSIALFWSGAMHDGTCCQVKDIHSFEWYIVWWSGWTLLFTQDSNTTGSPRQCTFQIVRRRHFRYSLILLQSIRQLQSNTVLLNTHSVFIVKQLNFTLHFICKTLLLGLYWTCFWTLNSIFLLTRPSCITGSKVLTWCLPSSDFCS